ncbi:uncharacterized protein LOC128928178 isoform X2 [Callithrix jacchus]
MEPKRNQPGSWQVMENCLSICELTTIALDVNKGNGNRETQPPRGSHPGTCASVNKVFRTGKSMRTEPLSIFSTRPPVSSTVPGTRAVISHETANVNELEVP